MSTKNHRGRSSVKDDEAQDPLYSLRRQDAEIKAASALATVGHLLAESKPILFAWYFLKKYTRNINVSAATATRMRFGSF